MDEYVGCIRQRVLERMDLSREMSDEEIENLIGEEASRLMQEEPISIRERLMLEARVFNSLRKLDALQELLDDPEISEIMVNGPKHIFYEKAGKVHAWNQAFASEEKMQDVIQQIVGRHNRVVNLSNPIVDTRLADGSRVNIVLAPVSLDGSTITIRKFPEKPLDMQTLIQKGALPEDAAEFLKMLVRAKYNLLISGGTSSGKTTFLNALSQYIPEDERVITIEDSAELQIQGIKNLVRLETRNANMEGVQPVTIRDLIRTALRMRPDRILVGECRGAEAFDMLQALNTGHDGGLSTAHGNSSRDILSRLEMMVLMGMDLPIAAIRQQIASGIDLIVHLGRLPDKSRRVLEITEVCGVENGEIQISPIYQLEGTEGSWKWKHCGILKNRKKLEMAGLTREKGEIEDGLSRVSSEPEGGLSKHCFGGAANSGNCVFILCQLAGDSIFSCFYLVFHEASEKSRGRADAITACEGICGYSPEYQCGFTCWFLYRKCVERGRKRNTRIIWEKVLYVSGGKGDELFHQPQSTIGAAAGRFLNPKWKYGYCKFFRSFFICKTQRWKFCDNY